MNREIKERTKWFMDARFGMFIHWGLYSIPACGEWVMSQKEMTIEEYRKYFEQFDPVDYDPKTWVRLAKEAEVSIFSIGALSKESILYEVGYLKEEDFQALEKNKAVGDIASRYFDINGNIALKELDDRVVGFGLEELREKEWTIAIAVGVNKVDAIIGALKAGFMNVFYTDEKTARELLNRCA